MLISKKNYLLKHTSKMGIINAMVEIIDKSNKKAPKIYLRNL